MCPHPRTPDTVPKTPRQPYSDCIGSSVTGLQDIQGAETWPVSERLAAFFFMLLDAVEQTGAGQDDAVDSFESEVGGVTSEYRSKLRSALTPVMDAADVPAVNRLVADTAPVRFLAAELMLHLLSTSLRDQSEHRQRSAALADKTLAFVASLLASPIADNGLDILRYCVEAGYLPVDRVPFISQWLGLRQDHERPESDAADG